MRKLDWQRLLRDFADYLLLEKGLSDKTIQAYLSDMKGFYLYLQTQIKEPLFFSEEDILSCLELKAKNGITASSTSRFMTAMHTFCLYLESEGLIESDPSAKIHNPKTIKTIPHSLSEENVSAFLNAPDISSKIGLRDKAMLEMMYGTGLRVSELVKISFSDLHINDGYLMVRGKGDKDRMLPLSSRVLKYLNEYLATVRNLQDPKRSCKRVFLSNKAVKGITRIAFWQRIKFYCRLLGLDDSISPHTFRHAFATHLLNHDADLRSVQLLLGHSSLNTTQIYTHVATKRMHEVFNKTHPRG